VERWQEVWVSSWDGSYICRNAGGGLFEIRGTAIAMERLANFSDEVRKGWSNVSMEEERVDTRR